MVLDFYNGMPGLQNVRVKNQIAYCKVHILSFKRITCIEPRAYMVFEKQKHPCSGRSYYRLAKNFFN